jgi:hypothetical protein
MVEHLQPRQDRDRGRERRALDRLQAGLDHLGQQLVVVVGEGDPVAPGGPQPPVAGRRHAKGPVVAEHPEPGVGAVHDDRLGRAVVHHDDLQIPDALGERAVDRSTEQVGTVVGGDRDRRQR